MGPSRKVSYIEGDSNVSKTVKPVLEIPDESSDSLDEGIVAGERLCSFTVGPKVQPFVTLNKLITNYSDPSFVDQILAKKKSASKIIEAIAQKADPAKKYLFVLDDKIRFQDSCEECKDREIGRASCRERV